MDKLQSHVHSAFLPPQPFNSRRSRVPRWPVAVTLVTAANGFLFLSAVALLAGCSILVDDRTACDPTGDRCPPGSHCQDGECRRAYAGADGDSTPDSDGDGDNDASYGPDGDLDSGTQQDGDTSPDADREVEVDAGFDADRDGEADCDAVDAAVDASADADAEAIDGDASVDADSGVDSDVVDGDPDAGVQDQGTG